MMTPPVCIQCRKTPVKRARSNEHPQRGRRIIDDVAWRWTCSRRCNGLVNVQSALRSAHTKARVEHYRATYRQRRIQRYIAECTLVATSDGLVPIKAMVTAMMAIERTAYSRGWAQALRYHRTGLLPRDAKRTAAA